MLDYIFTHVNESTYAIAYLLPSQYCLLALVIIHLRNGIQSCLYWYTFKLYWTGRSTRLSFRITYSISLRRDENLVC